MPLIDDDQPEINPRLKADLMKERDKDTQGTVETLRRRMNGYKVEKKSVGEEREKKGVPTNIGKAAISCLSAASNSERRRSGPGPTSASVMGETLTALFDPSPLGHWCLVAPR
jgi:hypothetical protein